MADKRLTGRDEPILDPEIPILDSHMHLFDRPHLRYMFEDYLDDARAGHDIRASIYVETEAFARATGPELEKPLGEIEFANGLGAMGDSGIYPCRIAAAIVGYVDLRGGDAAAAVLEKAQALAPDRFRGIRQLLIESDDEAPYRFITNRPPRGLMSNPDFRKGFNHLSRLNLSFDAAVFHPQIPELTAFVDAYPDTVFILNHAGLAVTLTDRREDRQFAFDAWRDSMRDLARRPNVHCKIGGFGMPFWGFGFNERDAAPGYAELAAVWSPFIEASIEAFGTQRCMMESNFPPDARSCGFVPAWNAMKYAVRDYSADEKAALFFDNAARVYRIPR